MRVGAKSYPHDVHIYPDARSRSRGVVLCPNAVMYTAGVLFMSEYPARPERHIMISREWVLGNGTASSSTAPVIRDTKG